MQRETDISGAITSMKEALGVKRGVFSGGQLHAFRKGWAVCIWSFGEKSHYWVRSPFNLAYVESGCGMTVGTATMYVEGNYPRCKKCSKRVSDQTVR